MFSFFPPLLIILSLAGIAVIVLRRTPELREKKLPRLQKLWGALRLLGGKSWRYILELKQFSARQNFQEKFRRVSWRLPKPHLPFLARPATAEFFLEQGEAELQKENFAEAERKFIKVLEKDPKSEAAYLGLGKLYLAQKKFEEAAQTYKFLVKHFPANDSYYASLGQALHGQKLYERAVEAYEKAIELSPANAKRYANLGLTLEAQRHLEEAILNYRKAADMEKDNTQFLLLLSEALVKKGEKEEAQGVLEHILVLEPTNHLAREKLMKLKF